MAQTGALTDIGSQEEARGVTLCPGNFWRATVIIFFCSLALVFGAFTVGRKVNIDENVFVASAALLSRQGALIYRDFHYNHMPTLVLIYAALFRMTGYFLLAARTVSALCAAGSAAIFFHLAYKSFGYLAPRRRMWFALGFALLYLTNPLVTRTAGRAWNHDFPAFMSVLGFVAMSGGLKRSIGRVETLSREERTPTPALPRSTRGGGIGGVTATNGGCIQSVSLLAASGLLVGLAVTTRLTFATELLPFSVFVLIYPNLSLGRRVGLLAAFSIGAIVAVIPSAWVWAQSPVNAYFGNFQYPAFNTLWHSLHDDATHHRYGLLLKIWFFLFNTCIEMPGNGVVFGGFVTLVAMAMRWRRVLKEDVHCELFILVLLALSQIAAGLVPSPPFFQYYYAATPFMLLAVILALGQLPALAANDARNWIWWSCLGLTAAFGIPEYRDLPYLFWPPAWMPVHAHGVGEKIAAAAGNAQVLTLDPIYVLEGGLTIYPALGTGCFGIRVGDYLTSAQQAQYKMWGTDDVRKLFDEHPPQAVMISPGSDGEIEALFTQLAVSHGYMRTEVNKKNPAIILWTRAR